MRSVADAVVIGGGVHGCSVAYHLAAAGMRNVVLVEKAYLTAGGTGRSAAGIRHQFATEVNIRLAAASVRMMERLVDELEYRRNIELVQKGYLILAYSDEQLEQYCLNTAAQRAIDPDNRTIILSPGDIRELNPYLNLEGVVGGSFNPRDGHANPWHVTQAYADAAVRLGVEINRFTEVTGIDRRGERVVGVRTTRGDIAAPVVVNCSGPWGNQVSAMAGIDVPLYSQRHQMLVTEPLEQVCPMMVLSFTHETYFKQTPHGSFLMGYGDPAHEAVGLDQGSTWDFLEEAARRICFHMPALAQASVVRQWAGLYDMTPDSQAIVGPSMDVEGFYQDIGWSGHGFQLGPIVGKVLAEIVVGEEPSIDVEALRFERFAEGDLCPEPVCI
jgi:sarcosine oxidase subunit beta